MGRKSQSKQFPKKEAKENKFIQQKRKELAVLVDKLLKLTSIFQASTTAVKSWEHHLEIEAILKEVRNLEAPVQVARHGSRQANIDKYLKWLTENGAQFEGVEIAEFEGYDLGLKAAKVFPEGSLILTVPSKVMMTEKDAKSSDLAAFIDVDPLLQNMPNITLALFLLLEKNNPDSFWKPYIDMLPDKYSTILYFNSEELIELKPSPVFESSLKLYRSIGRQYAYFYNKINTLNIPILKKLQEIFTFDNYRWAVSSVMTRQNNIQLAEDDVTAFIPLWDMCNHEHGKITTDFNKELNRGECYALRDFKPGEQIFIFYGARSNADLFLHNGFVYPNNPNDILSLALGVSSSDPLHEDKVALLNKLGLSGVTHYNLYNSAERPISAELLAFIRIFNMNRDELIKWGALSMPGELVADEPTTSTEVVAADVDRRSYSYLLTRCKLIKSTYKAGDSPDTIPKTKIRSLHVCETQVLDGAIKYLESALQAPIEEEPKKE